jgi:hypothetical protein
MQLHGATVVVIPAKAGTHLLRVRLGATVGDGFPLSRE